VTSAFIIEVNSQLQPDPNEETAALLRVLIHKVDNTAFSGNVPSIPQWVGPSHTIIRVQAILFTSLATSLFSAFLAMLGKQWLNRYTSVDVRGSAIERGQNRQRKLDGIVNWYFDHMMELLPLMLQAALLLLGVSLSHYLWEINTTVASVLIGFTSFGVLFFFFIVIVGAGSVSCPYQTPGAQILRQVPGALHQIQGVLHHIPVIIHCIPDVIYGVPNILHHVPGALHHIPDIICYIPNVLYLLFLASLRGSICFDNIGQAPYQLTGTAYSEVNIPAALLSILLLPIWLILDISKAIIWLLTALSHWLEQGLEQQTALLDLHCILWTLQTSLDGPVRLSALNYLSTTTLGDFDLALVVDCFAILFGCVKTVHNKVVIAQGMEQLATASSMCCLQIFAHQMTTDPTLKTLEDTKRRFRFHFGHETYIDGLPFSHTLRILHRLSHLNLPSQYRWETQQHVQWDNYKPSSNEHIVVAHALTKITKVECQRRGGERVPHWILRFVLHSLSQSALPPASVVIDCLSIIAINLGCTPFNLTTSDERCVCI